MTVFPAIEPKPARTMKILPATALSLTLATLCPAGDAAATGDVQKVVVSAKPGGMMKYEQAEVTIKAGTPVELTFSNPDVLQHNLLILKPGTKDKVGALADAMISDPEGMKKGYVPASPDVLHATKLIPMGGSETLKFTIDTPGEYPILCTFPGHWRLMNAVLKVEK